MLVLRIGGFEKYDLKKSLWLNKQEKEKYRKKNISYSFESKKNKIASDRKIKRSKYNIFHKKNNMSVLWNTISDACVLFNEKETQYYEDNDFILMSTDFNEALYELGFLVDEDINELFYINLMRHEFSYSYPSSKHVDIEILPTQACNAKCFYCFQKDYRSITMDDEIVEQVIEYISNSVTEENDIRYIWFGGEPLLVPHIIDKIIKGVNSKVCNQVEYHSSIATNGILIYEETIEKFVNGWNVDDVVITIDGYKEEHNKRKALQDKEIDAYFVAMNNIKKLVEMGIHVTCRINLDKDNESQLDLILAEFKEYVHYENFSVQVTTLRDKVTIGGVDKSKYICPSEYREFYQKAMNSLKKVGLLKRPLSLLPIKYNANCIACSLNKIVINSNGKLFKCVQDSMGNENAVGDCKSGIRVNDNFSMWYRDVDDLGNECNNCTLLPCCHGGCKLYRIKPSEDTTKCLRTKYYLNIILDEIINVYGGNVTNGVSNC